MRWLAIAVLVGCGGAECRPGGEFAAALQLSSDSPACAADPRAFDVVLTLADGTWTVTQDGIAHPAEFAFAKGCNADLFWYDRTITPAVAHEYNTEAVNPYADVAHIGVCSQRYSLTRR